MALKNIKSDATTFQPVGTEARGPKEPSTVIFDSSEQFGQFEERTDFLLDKFEYPRKGKEPGLVLIFNQVHFSKEKSRLGSYRDVNEIILCFSRLGFNLQSKYIFTDLTKTEISKTIHSVLSEDLTEVNSIIVFFLTHGSSKNKLMASDKAFSATPIWKQFGDNKHLKDKPKMFVFQACKGSRHSKPKEEPKRASLVPHTTFSVDCVLPDMVIVFSTIEGSVSFRSSTTGSWFIQELCRNFAVYGRRDDVITLLTRVNKCVARNYVSDDGAQQMPVFISTLNKLFYLNRNKDRSTLYEFNQENDEILNSLNDLNMRVEEMEFFNKMKEIEEEKEDDT